jgi:hypothetical protein
MTGSAYLPCTWLSFRGHLVLLGATHQGQRTRVVQPNECACRAHADQRWRRDSDLDAFRAQLTVRFTSKRFVRPTRPAAPATLSRTTVIIIDCDVDQSTLVFARSQTRCLLAGHAGNRKNLRLDVTRMPDAQPTRIRNAQKQSASSLMCVSTAHASGADA